MCALEKIVKANDIRGLVPAEFTPLIARCLGAAFADLVSRDERAGRAAIGVVIGHDMRDSAAGLVTAFADGVRTRGLDVTLIGLCSTDGLYHASATLGLPGAMFTASHNPAEYNGIKLCYSGARPVGSETGLLDVKAGAAAYLAGDNPGDIPVAQVRGDETTADLLGDYAAFLRSLVDIPAGRALKVVVDAGNGMAGLTAGAVLGTDAHLPDLGIELVRMYFDLDGSFPNHEPNPLDPANLVDLQAAVIAEEADLGLAFDGDADRCFVIDDLGVEVSPSAITALVALRELAKERAAGRDGVIVHNLITSRAVSEFISAAGGQAVQTRVGHAFIKAEMAAHDAVFGGEHSAHFYFRDFFYADSGMLAALHVIAVLAEGDLPLSDIADMYTPYVASGEINSTVTDVPATLAALRAAYADDIEAGTVVVDATDGLTFSHWQAPARWWFNVRPSNTEPLLRLNVEAEDHDIMEKVRDGVLGLIREGPPS